MTTPKAQIPSGIDATARDEAMRRIDALPPHILNGLNKKELQLVDSCWYVVKPTVNITSIRMFKDFDKKGQGIGNVSDQKLEKNNFFLPYGIQLVRIRNGNAGPIQPEVANGDFTFKANGKYMLPRDTSCRIFARPGQPKTNGLVGFYRLQNLKWIEPEADIAFDIRFSSIIAGNALALYLHGVTVIPYL